MAQGRSGTDGRFRVDLCHDVQLTLEPALPPVNGSILRISTEPRMYPEDPVGTVVPMELPLEGKVALRRVVGELPADQCDRLLLSLTDVSAREALRLLVAERNFPKWEVNQDGGSEMKGPCPGPLFDLVKAKLAEVNADMARWKANRDDDTFHHAFEILQGMEEIKRRLDPDHCLCL